LSVKVEASSSNIDMTASSITATAGTNTNTITPQTSKISDGTSTVTVGSDEISIADGSSKTSSIKNSILTFVDGTISTIVDLARLIITDGTNLVNLTISGKSQIKRADSADSVLEVKNTSIGGLGLDVDVASDSDTALRISNAGVVSTKMTAGQNWLIAGKNVIWSAGAAPTSGLWNLADIAYNSAPSAGGKVGWIFVTKPDQTCDTSNASQTLSNVTNVGTFSIGDEISGSGIQPGSLVTAIDAGASTLTINQTATADATTITISVKGWKGFGSVES
jgi:hypothetical protein